ncbi:MAG: hypothetical protein WD066_01670 [Planctomycetaceae bacterium]
MNVSFRKSFQRDVKKIKDAAVLDRVREVIEEVEAAEGIHAIGNLRKISGTANCHRIRIGDDRIGIIVEDDEAEFVRCLPRRDLDRFFP